MGADPHTHRGHSNDKGKAAPSNLMIRPYANIASAKEIAPIYHYHHRYYETSYSKDLSLLQAFARGSRRRGRRSDVWDPTVMTKGVEMLLDLGLDPNAADRNGNTVLHDLLHSHGGCKVDGGLCDFDDILQLLLKKGLSPDTMTSDGSNALHFAARISESAVKTLVANGVDFNKIRGDGKTPLMVALQNRNLVTARNLLGQGADPNITDKDANTPLHSINMLSDNALDLDLVRVLLESGADPNKRNKRGDTALHSGELKPKMLDLFLKHGFDLEAKNRRGHTLLFHSVMTSFPRDGFRILLDAGSNPNSRDSEGATILHTIVTDARAIGVTVTELFRCFVDRGLDPQSVDNSGNNLWHAVASRPAAYHDHGEQLAMMKLLLELNVSPVARKYGSSGELLVSC